MDTQAAAQPTSAAIAAIGEDHTRLSYAYLNCGDIDAYASLFHADVVVRRPDATTIHGRDALEHMQACANGRPPGRYIVHNVFASGRRVAATGRYEIAATGTTVEFADIFTIAESGLILAQSTYFFVPPASVPPKAGAMQG
jgi:hypothetical protein